MVLKNIDFNPGQITCNNLDFDQTLPLDETNSYLTGDILQVSYPFGITLDVGWGGGLSRYDY